MAGESQQLPESAPDPSVLTSDSIYRSAKAERDYVNGQLDVLRQRLTGIDRATALLDEQVHRVPTETQQAVHHLRELIDEKFRSVGTQFVERDTRGEREARDNAIKVDAAFSAQKEAASEKDKANTLAIGKSEEGTKEKIDKLAELFDTSIRSISEKIDTSVQGLSGKIDDVKERITAIELRVNTVERLKQGGREQLGSIYAMIAAAVAILTIIVLAANGVFAK